MLMTLAILTSAGAYDDESSDLALIWLDLTIHGFLETTINTQKTRCNGLTRVSLSPASPDFIFYLTFYFKLYSTNNIIYNVNRCFSQHLLETVVESLTIYQQKKKSYYI
jgi:hypothetical protein